jgi:hypothetical protein
MEDLDDVDELHGILHLAWRVFTELLSQILGQAVG